MKLDFTETTKPTKQQVRYVWETMKEPSTRAVAEELCKRGAKISAKTVHRWQQGQWIGAAPPPSTPRPPKKDKPAAPSPMLGGALDETELKAMVKDKKELDAVKEVTELEQIQRRDQLIYNIMLLRASQRRVDILSMIPKDTAPFIESVTEAVRSPLAPGLPMPAQITDQSNMIDITPNPDGDAITAFLRDRKRKVA